MSSSAKHAATPRHGGKKALKAKLLREGEQLKAKYPRISRKLVCALCGLALPRGTLLEHKEKVHAEKPVVRSPELPHDPNRWVPIVGGGLPSLGKRSR